MTNLPSSWKLVKLQDVCNIQGGYSFESSDFKNVGIPLVRIASISDNSIANDGNTVFIDIGSLNRYKDFIINRGDILIALSGATTGKYGLYNSKELALLNQRVGRLSVKSKDIITEYLFHCMPLIKNKIVETAYGAAQPNISTRDISNLQIPLPPLDVQKKIAYVLDKADTLRRKRKEAIAKLDELLQSTFLDMFGDPVTNPKGWPVKKLGEVCSKEKGAIRCGPFGSQLLLSDLIDEGIPVYGIDNVQMNKFVWAKPKFISEEKFTKLFAFRIKPKDILISRTGTVGRTCIAPDNIDKCIIGPNLLKISLDTNTLLPKVLSCAINYNRGILSKIQSLSPGATVAVFNTSSLKELTLPIPEMNLQMQYEKVALKIEETKSKMMQSITLLDKSFNSLLQRAFKGELEFNDNAFKELEGF